MSIVLGGLIIGFIFVSLQRAHERHREWSQHDIVEPDEFRPEALAGDDELVVWEVLERDQQLRLDGLLYSDALEATDESARFWMHRLAVFYAPRFVRDAVAVRPECGPLWATYAMSLAWEMVLLGAQSPDDAGGTALRADFARRARACMGNASVTGAAHLLPITRALLHLVEGDIEAAESELQLDLWGDDPDVMSALTFTAALTRHDAARGVAFARRLAANAQRRSGLYAALAVARVCGHDEAMASAADLLPTRSELRDAYRALRHMADGPTSAWAWSWAASASVLDEDKRGARRAIRKLRRRFARDSWVYGTQEPEQNFADAHERYAAR